MNPRTVPGPRRFTLSLLILTVPLLLALLGPLFAGDPGPRAASFTLGGGHWAAPTSSAGTSGGRCCSAAARWS